MSKIHVTTTINGDAVEYLCDPAETLLDVLRNRVGLTGAKEGCGSGDCGACSVELDGRLVCSCLVLAAEAEGRSVDTVEGMADGEKLHVLQQKILDHAHCNAVFVRRAFWWRPRLCWKRTLTRPKPRCGIGWQGTCAVAPVTIRLSVR